MMNRTSELTDAYVELRFADYPPQSTDICKKSLNPVWNEDFRFEIGDDQDAFLYPFEARVYDHDTITSNDIVGTAAINLSSLLNNSADCEQISGWSGSGAESNILEQAFLCGLRADKIARD